MPAPILPTRRRWFRFGLRSLLVFTALVGLLMGWIVKERRQSAREMQLANALREQRHWIVGTGGRFDSFSTQPNKQWWRQEARKLLGDRIVHVSTNHASSNDLVVLAQTSHLYLLSSNFEDIFDLTPVSALTDLEILQLRRTKIADVQPLSRLVNLKGLDISLTSVRDLTPLANLHELQLLRVGDTRDMYLTPIASLTKLHTLIVHNTDAGVLSPLPPNLKILGTTNRMSEEQLAALKRRLPNVLVFCDVSPDWVWGTID